MSATCTQFRERFLAARFDGTSDRQQLKLAQHLNDCDACRTFVAEAEAALERYESLGLEDVECSLSSVVASERVAFVGADHESAPDSRTRAARFIARRRFAVAAAVVIAALLATWTVLNRGSRPSPEGVRVEAINPTDAAMPASSGWAVLAPPPAFAGTEFGASVGLSAGQLVVGAPAMVLPEASEPAASQAALFDLARDLEQWRAADRVVGSGRESALGARVAIDGSTVVVGDPSALLPGRVRILEREAAGWRLASTLETPLGPGDRFGEALAIVDDLLVVGARGAWDSDRRITGGVFVYRRSGNDWQFEQRLEAAGVGQDAAFGYSVATDGRTIIVGARGEDITGLSASPGSVYLFERRDGAWREIAGFRHGETPDFLGESVAVDGSVAVASAVYGAGGDPRSGAVYVYERDADGWRLAQEVRPRQEWALSGYGHDLALDGSRLLVSARRSEGGAGTALLYESDNGQWRTVDAPGRGRWDFSAPVTAVALDGDLIAIGLGGAEGGSVRVRRAGD